MKKFLISEKDYSLLMFILLFINILMERLAKEYVLYSEILCILFFAFLMIIAIKNKKFYKSDIGICLLGLSLVTIVSTFTKLPNNISSLNVPIIMIIYYLIPRKNEIYNIIKKEKLIHTIIILTVLLLSVASLLNGDTMENTGRLKGIFGHPNTLASYNLFAIFSIIQMISTKNRKKVLWILCLVPTIYTIYKTGSRTCLLVMTIFFLLYLFYLVINNKKYNLKKMIMFSVIFLSLSILVVFIFKEQVISFLLRGKNISDMSISTALNAITSGRYYMWTKEIPYMMEDNWLIGYGDHGLIDVAFEKRMYDSLIMDDWLVSSHNFIFDTKYYAVVIPVILRQIVLMSLKIRNERHAKLIKPSIAVSPFYIECIYNRRTDTLTD